MPQVDGAAVNNLVIPDPRSDLDEAEHRRHVVVCTLRYLEHEFSADLWKAFDEYVVKGRPAAEVAAQFGMKLGSIYGAKSKVLSRLRQELAGLVEEL